ncbi:hypothetical protein vseg_004307 [Gypsophila vaccaria]
MVLTLSNQFLSKPPTTTRPNTNTTRPNNPTKPLQISCRKKELHPEFHEDAKVYCNGELVMTTGGTQKDYTVDVWSGNHPFYLGNRSAVLFDADQVEKFRKKYEGLSQIMEIPVLKGEIILPPKKTKAGAKKKK